MSGVARLSDLARQVGDGPEWAMVRTHFDIRSFGVNAYVAREAGGDVIGEHDELIGEPGETPEHEELYFVAQGHATFTVNGDEIDAPAGTFVFVRDPAARRGATAREAGTAILVVGARAGEAFTPSLWERKAPALAHFATEEYGEAAAMLEELLAETPDDPGILYNLARAESLMGKRDDALAHLGHAVEGYPDFGGIAEKDSAFDAIRDDPGFGSAIAGKPDTASTGP